MQFVTVEQMDEVHYLNTNTGKYLEVHWEQIPNGTGEN